MMMGEEVRVWMIGESRRGLSGTGKFTGRWGSPPAELNPGDTTPVAWHVVVTGVVAFERWYLRIQPHPDGTWSMLDIHPD